MKNILIDFSDIPNAIANDPALVAAVQNLRTADAAVNEAEDHERFSSEQYAARCLALTLQHWNAAAAYATAMAKVAVGKINEALA